jgi:hypothetical protein
VKRERLNATILLSRTAAVEKAFCLYADGKVPPPAIFGVHDGEGSFHAGQNALRLLRAR